MEIIDWFTIVIAIYGAIVSSILGIRELKRDRRKVSILLIREEWMESYSLTITNTGYRPITIIDIHFRISNQNVPRGAIRKNVTYDDLEKEKDNWKLPITLSDGEHVKTFLSEVVSSEIDQAITQKEKVVIEVYDAEGNCYSKYEKINHDLKYGFYRRKDRR